MPGTLASTRSMAAEPPTLRDLEAHRQPLGQLADVGHDADHAAAGAQLVEGGGDDVERVGVERAEPLVEEERLEPGRPGDASPATWSARARASAREARNVSPPDSVRAERTWDALVWSTTPKPPDRPSTVRA